MEIVKARVGKVKRVEEPRSLNEKNEDIRVIVVHVRDEYCEANQEESVTKIVKGTH